MQSHSQPHSIATARGGKKMLTSVMLARYARVRIFRSEIRVCCKSLWCSWSRDLYSGMSWQRQFIRRIGDRSAEGEQRDGIDLIRRKEAAPTCFHRFDLRSAMI